MQQCQWLLFSNFFTVFSVLVEHSKKHLNIIFPENETHKNSRKCKGLSFVQILACSRQKRRSLDMHGKIEKHGAHACNHELLTSKTTFALLYRCSHLFSFKSLKKKHTHTSWLYAVQNKKNALPLFGYISFYRTTVDPAHDIPKENS